MFLKLETESNKLCFSRHFLNLQLITKKLPSSIYDAEGCLPERRGPPGYFLKSQILGSILLRFSKYFDHELPSLKGAF